MQVGVLGQLEQLLRLRVGRTTLQMGAGKVVQQHHRFGKALQQCFDLIQAVGADLHAHGNALSLNIPPSFKPPWVVKPYGLVRCCVTGNEHACAT